jgi:hypothetical protein
MAFELFTTARTPEPFISIGKEGFRLSAGFLHTYHLERATAVRLYFDRTKRAIGFQFPTGAGPHEGALQPKRHEGGLVIRAQAFFSKYGIDPAKSKGQYPSQEVQDRALKRLFVIQLPASTISGHRPVATTGRE